MTKPIVAVLGITGKQGGSVGKALLNDGKYHVRGITRDVSKPDSKALIAQGVELIQGDALKEESLTKLFHGAQIVFAMTNFWDPTTGNSEEDVGKLTADVAKKAGVEFFVWSTLPNCKAISNNKYNVPHFDLKAHVDDHIRSIGIKHAFIAPSFFMENFQSYFTPKKGEDGTYTLVFPYPNNVPLAIVSIEDDFGPATLNLINNRHEWNGKWVPLFGDNLTTQEFAKQIGEAYGITVNAIEIPRNSFGEEFGQMFGFYAEYGFGHAKSTEADMHKLLPKRTTLRDWLQKKLIKI